MKLINSFHSLNRFVKNLLLKASLLSYEVLKLTKSFHRLNQFLNQQFQQWKISIFPSCFIDEIGSWFFFSCKNWFFLSILFEFWKFEIFEVILKAVTIREKFEISKQEVWAIPWKFHNKNQFVSFKGFSSKTTQAMKLWIIASYFIDKVGSQKVFAYYSRAYYSRIDNLKNTDIFFNRKILNAKKWVFAYKLIEL